MCDRVFFFGRLFECEANVIGQVDTQIDFFALVALYLIDEVEAEELLNGAQLLKPQYFFYLLVPVCLLQKAEFFSFAQQIDDQEQ